MYRNLTTILALILLCAVYACEEAVEKERDRPDRTERQELRMEEILKKGVIYEVNIRQYTPEGTFDAFTTGHLERLGDMGVDIIWLMPIHPIGEKNRKGELGSYYSVKDYKGVNPEFGTEEDLRALINKAHELDMIVVLDWVPNHTSWDAVWTESHPEFYVTDNGEFIYPRDTDWTDVIQLDYDNQEMRDSMIAAMKYWLKEFDIDGFRCDVAGYVPNDFWEQAIPDLRAVKPVFMLAEWEDPDHHKVGFDMSYAWELHSLMNELARMEAGKTQLLEYWEKETEIFPVDAIRMVFIDNHDENSWNGTIEERMGPNADAMAVFSFTFPGMPLIYTGQEAALDFRLPFFEKSEVPWRDYSKQEFYTALVDLKKDHPALWNAHNGGEPVFFEQDEQLMAWLREVEDSKVLTLVNLSDEAASFSLPVDFGEAEEYFSGETKTLEAQDIVEIESHGYRVFIGK
ncbi:MAG: alpha-amylase [Saprospirales bacterium]|nr:MAG: alpha-amylase [Saprospirales bacterium]